MPQPDDIYEQLEKASPDEKREIVLKLIAEHPEGRLELPAKKVGKWEWEGADLSGADLGNAKLSRADLSGADLSRADLSRADLGNAKLGRADLSGADLSRADLSGAYLWRPNLRNAKLSEADLSEADLRNADPALAGLSRANLREADLRKADLREAKLSGANLNVADLREANLWNADLYEASVIGADLRKVDLRYAKLNGAKLREAKLSGADLSRANLREAELHGANFTRSNLNCIYIARAWLEKTRLDRDRLGGTIGEEIKAKNNERGLSYRISDYNEARNGYLILKQNFDELGDYDAASWAYRKERRMEKMEAKLTGHEAVIETFQYVRDVLNFSVQYLDVKPLFQNVRTIISNYTQYALDKTVELLCDYGESIPRTLVSMFVVYALFTFICWVSWGVERNGIPTRDFYDVILFSLGAMTTMNPTGLEASNRFIDFLAGIEALLGIALTGLLGFVIGNRIRQS